MTPDQARRVRARRLNEETRLTATLLNNLAVGVFIGGLVGPAAAGRELGLEWYAILTAASVALHVAGRLMLRTLKPEE